MLFCSFHTCGWSSKASVLGQEAKSQRFLGGYKLKAKYPTVWTSVEFLWWLIMWWSVENKALKLPGLCCPDWHGQAILHPCTDAVRNIMKAGFSIVRQLCLDGNTLHLSCNEWPRFWHLWKKKKEKKRKQAYRIAHFGGILSGGHQTCSHKSLKNMNYMRLNKITAHR